MADDLRPIIMEKPIFVLRTRDSCEIPVFRGRASDPRILELEVARFDANPKLTRRRDADPHYNCHGLTFIARHGCIGVIAENEWLIKVPGECAPEAVDCTDDHIERLLTNSGFRLVRRLANYRLDFLSREDRIDCGDIVIYRDQRGFASHSAVVWSCDPPCVTVLSKLGGAGEYFHEYRDLPDDMYGVAVEFWSDRGRQS